MPKKVKGKEKRKNKFDRGLLSLPREILLLVRAQMHSLEAHVAFSLACRATKSLYDDKFWRSALITSGWSLSRLSDDTKQALRDDPKIQIWAGLTRIIDEDARSCDNEDWRINMWAEIPEEADCVLHTTKDTIFEEEFPDREHLKPRTPKELKEAKVKIRQAYEVACICSWSWSPPGEIFKVQKLESLLEHPYMANRHFTDPPTTCIKVSDGLEAVLGYYDSDMPGGMGGPQEQELKVVNPWGVTSGEAYLATAVLIHEALEGIESTGDLAICNSLASRAVAATSQQTGTLIRRGAPPSRIDV